MGFDLGNMGGMGMPDMGGLTGGGTPDISKLMQSLDKPQYEQSGEFGTKRDSKFNALTDYELPNLEIRRIVVRAGSILDGIIVTYADGSTVQHGGNGGGASAIDLNGDIIKQVTGYCNVGFGGRRLISGLRIVTGSGRVYGPYGSDRRGNEFSIFKEGHRVAAFFGSTDGGYISSLGAFLLK